MRKTEPRFDFSSSGIGTGRVKTAELAGTRFTTIYLNHSLVKSQLTTTMKGFTFYESVLVTSSYSTAPQSKGTGSLPRK